MNKNFEIEIKGLGHQLKNKNYPGAFTPTVEAIIRSVIYGRVLHLFSGVSLIGEVRVDLATKEATDRIEVLDFLKKEERNWDFLILDPPYEIQNTSKLKGYSKVACINSDIPLRRALTSWAVKHTKNILWLDYSAPLPVGFKRKKLWLLLPGGFHRVRILSWLENLDFLTSRWNSKLVLCESTGSSKKIK